MKAAAAFPFSFGRGVVSCFVRGLSLSERGSLGATCWLVTVGLSH